MRYRDCVLMDAPSLYLPLTETSGNFLDHTGNGYDAEVFGTLMRGSTVATVDGMAGVQVGPNWDGYAICQKGPHHIGRTVFTLEAWVYPTYNASAWLGYQVYEQLAVLPGHLGTRNAQYHGLVSVAHTGTYYGDGLTVVGGVNSHYYFQTGDSRQRDDASNTPVNQYYDLTFGAVSSKLWAVSMVRQHVVIRKSLAINTNIAANRTAGNWSTSLNSGCVVEMFSNGSIKQAGTQESSVQSAYHNYGLGIFGYPTSASTVTNKARYAWVSNVAVYPYALSDAQILRHYQAGAGTLSGNRVAGTTMLDGVATGGFPVFIHRRDTGALIGRTMSESNGSFSCNVGTFASQVYAVAFDPVSGNNYPAQVFDLIVPSI